MKNDGYTADDGRKYKTLDLRQVEALEVESIRYLKAQNDALRARVEALEANRRPVTSYNPNWGIGMAGLVIGGAVFLGRRKRDEKTT